MLYNYIDACIQPLKSLQNNEDLVSEVLEWLLKETYKDHINHIKIIAKEFSCISEDLPKRKYPNFKCLKPSRTCQICIEFRKKLCSAYHLVDTVNNEYVPNEKWIKCIEKKFEGSNFYWLSAQIAKYSSYDFEVELRNIFEDNYTQKVDKRHYDRKENLKNESIMDGIINTDYWFLLISKIMILNRVGKHNSELFTCEKNEHFIKNIKIEKKIKRFLNTMGIFYSNVGFYVKKFGNSVIRSNYFKLFKIKNA